LWGALARCRVGVILLRWLPKACCMHRLTSPCVVVFVPVAALSPSLPYMDSLSCTLAGLVGAMSLAILLDTHSIVLAAARCVQVGLRLAFSFA
jgi:hypothetical protein